MNINEFYIQRCLQIAKNGIGSTRPNPSVGAVIVYKNKIIGEGFTSVFGGNHAEVNAIHSVSNKELLKKATLYVTLEPCSHFGKTPPCAALIVKHQIQKVVIGCLDPNPKVSGKGVAILKKSGIKVITGVLENECKTHHKRFLKTQEVKRPYIILKWAQTKDGFIAPQSKNKTAPVFISNHYSQQLVHQLRAKEHGILVGTNTVLQDNPKLNVRSWFGNNPIRIFIDRDLKIPKESHVYNATVKTICITEKVVKSDTGNLFFEVVDFSKNLAQQICTVLQKHQIQSVIVEGGAKALQTFINENLWDEALVFVSNTTFKNGTKAPKFNAKIKSQKKVMDNTLNHYYND